jgi:hypothetical protein
LWMETQFGQDREIKGTAGKRLTLR